MCFGKYSLIVEEKLIADSKSWWGNKSENKEGFGEDLGLCNSWKGFWVQRFGAFYFLIIEAVSFWLNSTFVCPVYVPWKLEFFIFNLDKWLTGEVQCEQPNNSLYTFTGNLIMDKQTIPLSPNQLLLRVIFCSNLFLSFYNHFIVFLLVLGRATSLEFPRLATCQYLLYILHETLL